ncbi:EcWRKY-64 [Eragrostis curvula]|uniref:EcWRKY-32 n=1 Tax=Eragrostis curvula TaxID=38414 RepID=A0A5J9SI61_9POAL|nr:EcWRKY-32 [Eragrostis curvula]TVU21483.1 EcWRKY-64 [Eragrostis curvula]
MFPSPGRAVMARGHGTQLSSTAGAGAMAAASSSTPTITFAFQPSPPPTSGLSHHHGVLGYSSSLVLDRPTTTTTTSSSSSHAPPSTIPSPNLHHFHGTATAHVSPPTRSSPPHPWSCDDRNQDKQRGKGAALTAGSGGAPALGVGAVRMKKAGSGGGKARRKVREPRFCFKTMSDVDVLDDGYKWRKYGQKVVKNTQHPRSYYRCTQDNCRVKKRVERLAEDPRMVITTYEGRHVHSPSRDDDDDAARANAEMSFIW